MKNLIYLINDLIQNASINTLVFSFDGFLVDIQMTNGISRALAANKNLKKFSLQGFFHDRAEENIVTELMGTNLTELSLLRSESHRDHRAPAALATAMARLLEANRTITHLTVTHSGFSDGDAKIFLEGVKRNPTLTHLALEQTRIGFHGQEAFAGMLKVNRNLMSFQLVWSVHNNGDPAQFLFEEALQGDATVESLQVVTTSDLLRGNQNNKNTGIYIKRDPQLALIVSNVKKAMFEIPDNDLYISTSRLTIDILAFRFSSKQGSLHASYVLSSLKNAVKSAGAHFDALNETHYLKEFERYILGHTNALMFDNKKSQYRAMFHLLKPFNDEKLGKEANILLAGIINSGVMQDFPDAAVKLATDLLLLDLYLKNSYLTDSHTLELSVYFRLFNHPMSDEMRENLCNNRALCLVAFNTMLNDGVLLKRQTRAEFIKACRETIIQGLSQALKLMPTEPASHLKTVGLFPQVAALELPVGENITLIKK